MSIPNATGDLEKFKITIQNGVHRAGCFAAVKPAQNGWTVCCITGSELRLKNN